MSSEVPRGMEFDVWPFHDGTWCLVMFLTVMLRRFSMYVRPKTFSFLEEANG